MKAIISLAYAILISAVCSGCAWAEAEAKDDQMEPSVYAVTAPCAGIVLRISNDPPCALFIQCTDTRFAFEYRHMSSWFISMADAGQFIAFGETLFFDDKQRGLVEMFLR